GPPQRIEGFDISNISGTFAVASMVSFRSGRPDRANYRRFRIKSVEGQDDFASIAEVVRRRYTRVLNESRDKRPGGEGGDAVPAELQRLADDVGEAAKGRQRNSVQTDAAAADLRAGRAPGAVTKKPGTSLPDLVLIDGGKGQLKAACAEMEKLGLSAIPIIGLAKEFEEIYRPGDKEPLRLSHDSGALKLLQRVRTSRIDWPTRIMRNCGCGGFRRASWTSSRTSGNDGKRRCSKNSD